jgi:hypothetical protein
MLAFGAVLAAASDVTPALAQDGIKPGAVPRSIAPPAAAAPAGEDPVVAAAGNAALPPALRDLRDQVPPDPAGLARSMGLRAPSGPATDLRNRTPSSREIVDALAPR